jgi:hypothetical protein
MSAAAAARDAIPHGTERHRLVAALGEQLRSLRAVVCATPQRVYRSAPSGASGSVGAQVRHCLDHVLALVAAAGGETVTYDGRARGTAVERDREAAIAELDRLCLSIEHLTPAVLDRRVRLDLVTGRDGGQVDLLTTIGREAAYVTQHTIHHAAIIRLLIERCGVATGEEFGYAPSTPLAS